MPSRVAKGRICSPRQESLLNDYALALARMIVRTSKLLDGEILDLLAKLFAAFPSGAATVTLPLGIRRAFESAAELTEYEYSGGSRNIESMTFNFGGNVQDAALFQRGTLDPEMWKQYPNQTGFNTRRQVSAYYDELAFLPPHSHQGGSQNLSDDAKIHVAELLNELAAPTEAGSDEEARNLSKVISKQINDLRKLNLDMTQGLLKARAEQEASFSKRQSELDESFQTRLEQIIEREAELERRREELNDREPQHERRRLREHLTARLQSTITEPPPTTGRRERYSHYLYLAAAAVFILISIQLSLSGEFRSTSGSAAFWALSAKSLVAGIVGAALTWAGLAGLRTSAVAAREYEQTIQRYAFDMDRASWVVETILQMNSVEKSEVPDEWLEAVCRDLFTSTDARAEEKRSLEAFAALFDATAKARLGTNGIEFEIDRKGARKLAHEG